MSQKIKTAIIGIGQWGKNVARELNAVSDLVAYASRKPSSKDACFAEHIPLARRSTIKEICVDSTLKAVAIVTPISTQAAIARAMIEAGKHTFVEKPLGRSSAEAQELAEMASMRNLILMTGYLFLYHPVYQEVKRRVEIASVRSVTFEWRKYGSFTEPIETNLLVHHLALTLDLMGEPIEGAIRHGPGTESVCDEIETRLIYRGVEAISLIDRRSRENAHTMRIDLGDGSSYLWDNNRLFRHKAETANPQIVYEARETPLAVEIASFIDAAAGAQGPRPTAGDFGSRVLRLLEMLKDVK